MTRHVEIVETLQSRGIQSVHDLADRFGVTPSTIRRDLSRLEGVGLVRRTHGGAIPAARPETPDSFRRELHRPEKSAIGAAMAERILDGQTVLLSAGTTTLEVARNLNRDQVTVVTNDLRIATTIAQKQTCHLVFLGGELLPNSYSVWGPTALQNLSHLRVDVAVFGTDTVAEDGLYSSTSYEIELQRLMLAVATDAFFVADSSKFGRQALFKLADFEKFTAGVTDDLLDPLRASHFPIPIIQVNADRQRSTR